MTMEIKNIHWFGSDDKLIGFCDNGILITSPHDNKSLLIENENIWWGYFEAPYFKSVNIAEWS